MQGIHLKIVHFLQNRTNFLSQYIMMSWFKSVICLTLHPEFCPHVLTIWADGIMRETKHINLWSISVLEILRWLFFWVSIQLLQRVVKMLWMLPLQFEKCGWAETGDWYNNHLIRLMHINNVIHSLKFKFTLRSISMYLA